VTAQLEGAVDGHHDGLHVGALLAAVAQRVLANDDRRTNLALAVVVVSADAIVIEEGKQVIPILDEPLDQPLGVGVFPRRRDDFIEA